jgi:hypothetical protein
MVRFVGESLSSGSALRFWRDRCLTVGKHAPMFLRHCSLRLLGIKNAFCFHIIFSNPFCCPLLINLASTLRCKKTGTVAVAPVVDLNSFLSFNYYYFSEEHSARELILHLPQLDKYLYHDTKCLFTYDLSSKLVFGDR